MRNKTFLKNIIFLQLLVFSLSCGVIVHRPSFKFQQKGQQPTALKYLPKTEKGYVDWVVAMDEDVIIPRDSINSEGAGTNKPLDLDIIFKTKNEYPIPDVVFPHRPHTAWLGCHNCHPSPFRMKTGANPVTMSGILKGEFCGKCHGRVAFAISDCFRCHSKRKS